MRCNRFRPGLFALVLLGVALRYGSATPQDPTRRTSHNAPACAPAAAPIKGRSKMSKYLVYIGTYTSGKSKGIYIYSLDMATGALTPVGVASNVVNPSFLAIHPNHRFLYAVDEVQELEGEKSGAVSAFALDPKTGLLTFLNRQLTQGTDPCHLCVDSKGKYVLVANYSSGSLAVLPIQADGRLGAVTSHVQHKGSSVNPARQEGPHAHSIYLDKANHFALTADLGLDKVFVYHFHAQTGALTPNDPPDASTAPGAGPRHIAFSADQHRAYVIDELASTVTAFTYDSQKGALHSFQTISTLPEGFTGSNTTAEVQMHPSGKFLYGSNRGHNSIAIFAIDAATGKLSLIGHQSTQGKTPRNFCIDPTGTYLLAANQDSDSVVVFRIDSQTGSLTPVGSPIEVPNPVCIQFLPAAH